MTRREILIIGWRLCTAAAETPTLSRGLWAQPAFDDDPFKWIGLVANPKGAARIHELTGRQHKSFNS